MAKPDFCPALSTPPGVDEKTGTVKSGVMVKCKGAACALFRKSDQSCALGVVETLGTTTAIKKFHHRPIGISQPSPLTTSCRSFSTPNFRAPSA